MAYMTKGLPAPTNNVSCTITPNLLTITHPTMLAIQKIRGRALHRLLSYCCYVVSMLDSQAKLLLTVKDSHLPSMAMMLAFSAEYSTPSHSCRR